jgi:hypothetical protein
MREHEIKLTIYDEMFPKGKDVVAFNITDNMYSKIICMLKTSKYAVLIEGKP